MTIRTTTDLPGLSLMLAEFACNALEFGFLVTEDHVLLLEKANILSLHSEDRNLSLTGPRAYGMDDSMQHVADEILKILEQGCTIKADEALIRINHLKPFVKAYRPTLDVMIIETGGVSPDTLMLIIDRERGAII